MPARSHAYLSLIEEEDEEYERQIELRAKRTTDLDTAAVLGDDMRAFLSSPLGRELWKRAERDKVSAAMEMLELEVDAENFKEQFLALQAKGMGGTKFQEYCSSIEVIGAAALIEVREGDS